LPTATTAAGNGIIALVDEATGYQRDRAKDALSKILEAFIERNRSHGSRLSRPIFTKSCFGCGA
jgi:hypothetical protein